MNHQQSQRIRDWRLCFPWEKYPDILKNQEDALETLARIRSSTALELPTGSGKTAIGYTFLKCIERAGQGPLFYTVPTKTLVDQMKEHHPDVKTVYGRNEYRCLFYRKFVSAEESPCSLLECPHRLNLDTGQSEAEPCPYLKDKYLARQGGIVACTFAFHLFAQLFSRSWDVPAGLVIDEAHNIARITRSCLSYEISDFHLEQGIKFLRRFGVPEAESLNEFLRKMKEIIQQKPDRGPPLLGSGEITGLMEELIRIDQEKLQSSIRDIAITSGAFGDAEQIELLKRLEVVSRNISRYYRSLKFALPTESRNPLNYLYGTYVKDSAKEKGRISYRLFIKTYHVAPLIKRILSPLTLAYSATIGNPEIFGFETGLEFPCNSFPSDFPSDNARIYLPTDTPNLAQRERSHREPTKILRRIAKACHKFAGQDIRSLVVVVSEIERQKFLQLAKEEGVDALSYGNGVPPRLAAARFKAGEGKVLAGTVSNYGEGIDLPRNIAPVIFFLRPGYPSPNDPAAIFEERRFGGQRWKVWNWRVMIEALQVRGRNLRSAKDVGVAFFISRQFERFLFGSLPKSLQKSYEQSLSFDQCVDETLRILGKETEEHSIAKHT